MGSFRNEHDKLRLVSPRLKDLAKAKKTDAERPEDRDEKGRAKPKNQLAKGAGGKSVFKRWLSRIKVQNEETALLLQEWTVEFNAFLRSLPSTGPIVRAEAAAMARRAVMGSFYASKAFEAGLETDQGQKLGELSARHDQAASRHATAARAQAHLEVNTPKPEPIEATVITTETQILWAQSIAEATAELKK